MTARIMDWKSYPGFHCWMVRVVFYRLGTWWIEDMTDYDFWRLRGTP